MPKTTRTHRAPTIEEFKSILHRCGLKATRQRLSVHKAMLALGHASADMVSEAISGAGECAVTVASVYNILTQTALLGIYSHRMSANNKMYFDVNTFRHIHLYDSVNNTYRDIVDDELVDDIYARIGKRRFRGYRVESIDVQIVCRPSGSSRTAGVAGRRPSKRRIL